MDDIGTVFPPRNEWDVAAYPDDDVVEGYREWRPDDPEPGENRSPGYRWGWANGRRDRQGGDDGYDRVRQAYIQLKWRQH